MKRDLLEVGAGTLATFATVGALWVGLLRLVPAGTLRSVVAVVLGVAFAFTYVRLVVSRVGAILAGERRLILQTLIATVEIGLLLLAFGAVHESLGLMDNTRAGTPVVHEFWTSVYYSVVTFTTLGYGDFYPVGAGRVLAGIQALTGYLILGILASTASRVVSPHSKAGDAGSASG